ncbi:hypothetical protein HG530_001209 [Fusarium avenaceum]|nr:hypothetical protein HG530_001209 [Fusarium avenaceum]
MFAITYNKWDVGAIAYPSCLDILIIPWARLRPLYFPRTARNHSRRRLLIRKLIARDIHRLLQLIARDERIVALRRTNRALVRLAHIIILGYGIARVVRLGPDALRRPDRRLHLVLPLAVSCRAPVGVLVLLALDAAVAQERSQGDDVADRRGGEDLDGCPHGAHHLAAVGFDDARYSVERNSHGEKSKAEEHDEEDLAFSGNLFADNDSEKCDAESRAHGVDHNTMRLAPCRAGETLKELESGELEDPETAIVKYSTGHDHSTAQYPLINVLRTQIQAIQVDVIRAVLEDKVHTDSSQHQRYQCHRSDVVLLK